MRLLDKLFEKRSGRTTLEAAAANFARVKEAADLLGNPQDQFSSIHIAGTNGKGSVALKIAKALEFSGYKVGLFTSPHIAQFTERVQINGEEMPMAEVEKKVAFLLEKFPDLYFFDYITLLAFLFFAQQKVDVAVIEAGIGGRFDSTNFIYPLLSVITSIAFDHAELLGPTLDDIAYQKAGIIKPQVPVILGPKAQFALIEEEAKLIQSPRIKVLAESQDFDLENQATAKAALGVLKKYFNLSHLEKAVQLRPSCRFEKYGRFILDVAHNPAGIESLLKTWDFHYPEKAMNVIVALSMDKDLPRCLKLLADRADHLFLVAANSLRAASTCRLKEILLEQNIGHFTCCPSIADAVASCLNSQHATLVCGSFYIMQEVREEIFRLEVGLSQPSLGGGEPAH